MSQWLCIVKVTPWPWPLQLGRRRRSRAASLQCPSTRSSLVLSLCLEISWYVTSSEIHRMFPNFQFCIFLIALLYFTVSTVLSNPLVLTEDCVRFNQSTPQLEARLTGWGCWRHPPLAQSTLSQPKPPNANSIQVILWFYDHLLAVL